MSIQSAPMPSRQERQSSNSFPLVAAGYLCFGPFHVDLRNEELFKDGTRLKLQGKVYQALLALLQKPGEIVTREELRMQLWPADTHVNYDANVNTTVNKLRQVLGDSPEQPAFVSTIPRRGYSFVAKVEFLERPVTSRVKQPAKLSPVTAVERSESRLSFFRTALLSRWFTAGVVSLVIASMLFGAAIVLYAHR